MSESRNRTLAADHDAVPRGGTTVPAQDCRELDCLDRDTTRALAELRLARRVSGRTPTHDTARAEELAEWRLNRLLERRHGALRT
jgi:hypothetical protein